MDTSPIKLAPVLKDYIWGGQRLKSDFNKHSELSRIAESWELSVHPDGESVVASGAFKGKPLSQYIAENGAAECIGTNAAKFDFFPILIKLIDAKQNLSVQVHPDDAYALKNEGQYGKTEMWYVLDCCENAYLYYGLNRSVSKSEFKERAENGTITEILNKVSVKKGDVFFIPSGTVHAICEGILVCEIQQNSNTTYRIFDYMRRDANGNMRELHLDKALDVSTLAPAPKYSTADANTLAACELFTVKHLNCSDSCTFATDKSSFRSLTVIDGNGELELDDTRLSFAKGDSIFIPAQNAICEIHGKAELILSYV